LTSAYIVSRASVNPAEWDYFDLPNAFWISTGIILFSSLTMQLAVWAVRKGQDMKAMIALLVTFALGVMFLVAQIYGYDTMILGGKYFVDPTRADDSVSYFYIFTILHGVHIISALMVLFVCIIKTANNRFKVGGKVLTYEITATFWHFLDLLWVYLFVFLLFTQSQ
jgi:cytochrome c oxidase subunit 3